ncbi:MAG: hypothetical protein V4534_03315 [Myxococcota bacterium]
MRSFLILAGFLFIAQPSAATRTWGQLIAKSPFQFPYLTGILPAEVIANILGFAFTRDLLDPPPIATEQWVEKNIPLFLLGLGILPHYFRDIQLPNAAEQLALTMTSRLSNAMQVIDAHHAAIPRQKVQVALKVAINTVATIIYGGTLAKAIMDDCIESWQIFTVIALATSFLIIELPYSVFNMLKKTKPHISPVAKALCSCTLKLMERPTEVIAHPY